MYETEEEIKRKRRILLIIIGVVALLIILLLIVIFTRGSGRKKSDSDNAEISCELEVKSGTVGANGIYSTETEIGFKSITGISKDYEITKNTIGTTDNARNTDTYKITKSGTYKLHGYVQDAAGNKGTCDLDVIVNLTEPTCELEVKSGTIGENGWYITDVEVGFASMNSNSSITSIAKYYIEKQVVDMDTSEVIRADEPTDSTDTIKVVENQETTLVGYVIDSNGSEGKCTLVVKKDTTLPTCKLEVTSGTLNSSGEYTDKPVIELSEAKDDVSVIKEKGVGTSKNYTQTSFSVTADGTTKVMGYVKDEAGNEGSCSLEIKRPVPKPVESNPTCTLSVTGTPVGQNVYTGNVTVKMNKSTNNGATIVAFGIAESKVTNGKDTFSTNTFGKHTIYGMVKDSYDHTGYCQATFTIQNGTSLASKVSVGDLVAYDAGTWNETRNQEVKTEGYSWGFAGGTSKNIGVACRTQDKDTKNGWVVIAVNNGKVIIAHAGTPECVYHGTKASASTLVSTINGRANQYLNSKYGESASIMNCSTAGVSCEASKVLTGIYAPGTHYYLASVKDSTTVWGITSTGRVTGMSGYSQGIRPVIVLKSTVLTTGKDSNGAWILTN
ncbi:MAG: hypothetical protein IJ568_03265 [Bacilli bacterium]|nr:hypothetical protein [Bacilli bacterium]